ncbi:MAG: TrmH family RNA methyltransferase [Oscillospiraceae bacterium]
MERITSRKNQVVTHLIKLAKSTAYRWENREYVCDGQKLLCEALAFGAEVKTVLWRENPLFPLPDGVREYGAPASLFDYASPLRESPGPVFTLAIPKAPERLPGKKVIILENVQDPGNVGTVVRTANALGFDAVILVGSCADLYNPKTVRATMGAVFRQCVMTSGHDGLKALLAQQGLSLCGAALTQTAADLRETDLKTAAVAIGSEGRGLSQKMLDMCDRELIIPMQPGSESLNAAVAAAVIMWERVRRDGSVF